MADELKKLGHDIDRKIITMHEAKKVGDYVATVSFHKEVIVEIPVKVVDENAKAEVAAEAAPAAEAATEAAAEETTNAAE